MPIPILRSNVVKLKSLNVCIICPYYKRIIYLKINAFCSVSMNSSWLLGFTLRFQDRQRKGNNSKCNDNSQLHNRTQNVAATVYTYARLNMANNKKLER